MLSMEHATRARARFDASETQTQGPALDRVHPFAVSCVMRFGVGDKVFHDCHIGSRADVRVG